MLVTVARFSKDGFSPVYQSFLAEGIAHLQNTALEAYPEHLRRFIKEAQDSIAPTWEQDLNGYWAFVGAPDEIKVEDSRFFLNHLSTAEKAERRWHSTTLDGNTPVYLSCEALKANTRLLKDVVVGSAIYVPVTIPACELVAYCG